MGTGFSFLLRVILGREIRKVKITPQRVIQGHNTKEHGVRLDAYIGDISEEELMGNERGLDAEVVQQGDIYGAVKLYLYTKGAEGNPSQNLIDMLKYIEKSMADHIINPDIRRVDELVREIKENEEVGVAYMKSWEREEYIRRAGIAEGLEQREIQCILSMHEKGYALDAIADVLEKTVEEIRSVIEEKKSVLA